ncbi:MAG: beta-lactamase family protein [Defluviitaleaceae bacterium]|nr:beta-lactamase family protein [Defluviitaleaceae bacterium]
MMKEAMKNIFETWLREDGEDFMGVVCVTGNEGVLFEQAVGMRNKSEALPNTVDTAFGIASGTKLFTGLAICKLIDCGKLSLEDKLCDVVPMDLGLVDKGITIFHLLTHTSGVGDYLDDEDDDVIEKITATYAKHPVHLWTNLTYYLQHFTQLPPKFAPGERYGYSNAGYILLGLVIEAVSGCSYQDYVTDALIRPLGLVHTGFYRMDQLPPNVAVGYTQIEGTDAVRTNIYDITVVGSSAGGLFSCVADLDKVWRALAAGEILSPAMTQAFLSPQVQRDAEDDERFYGFGLYYLKDEENAEKIFHYALGCDAGVNIFTAYFPKFGITATALGNLEDVEVIPLMYEIVDGLYDD